MPYEAPDQNPLDPGVVDYQPETPPLDEVIRHGVLAEAMRLRVCVPASVVAVGGDQQVDLQPLFKSRYVDGDVVTLPILKDVPVSMPMGAQWGLRYPLAVGDMGWAVFADRALDAWLAGDGGPTDPQETRMHDLNDAIFVPGLVPTAQQTKDGTTDLTVRNGKTIVRLKAQGKIQLGNGSQELLDLLSQCLTLQANLLQTLATNTLTLTALGPQPFLASTVAALQQLAQTNKQIQTDLGVLKG